MGHATFMILGGGCTRRCRFCAVKKDPEPLDKEEPARVAEAVLSMGFSHAVITSVTRDDLPDGGASIFAETICGIRRLSPSATIEVLTPDFKKDEKALKTVLAAKPDIFGHNLETIARLYEAARPQADYCSSLSLLRRVKMEEPLSVTKSGLMLGLGETENEVIRAMEDLRGMGVDVLSLGQYLRPGPECLPVCRYYRPEEFHRLKEKGEKMGFSWVEAGPLVRSSYGAREQARTLCRKKGSRREGGIG